MTDTSNRSSLYDMVDSFIDTFVIFKQILILTSQIVKMKNLRKLWQKTLSKRLVLVVGL